MPDSPQEAKKYMQMLDEIIDEYPELEERAAPLMEGLDIVMEGGALDMEEEQMDLDLSMDEGDIDMDSQELDLSMDEDEEEDDLYL